MKFGCRLLSFALSALPALPARAVDIVFGVSTGSAMPMTQFTDGHLTGGLLKDFGDALARELHMTPRYLNLPRKRVEEALVLGRADLLCDLRPEWLDGKHWLWSDTVFTNKMIVASRADTAPLAQLSALAEQRVGTVLGYRYPELESALGTHFLRDEAGSDDVNLTKLLRGRFQYLLANSLYYDFQRKVHPERARLNGMAYEVLGFDTSCAMPSDGKLRIDQVNRAIAALRKRGEMQIIMDRYRPLR
jgi:polar amino acid transport system substrate-binding protein